ncbi:DEAD/DEAH box helicase [Candidatus Woesearchaeota archaeon]|nr:DEAD/DEAH box helicase [Candidatus Woesearchaeota archaeon]
MHLKQLKKKLPAQLYAVLEKKKLEDLRPCQEKAIKAGLLNHKNMLVCTPTGSGKTLVAEIAALNAVLNNEGKAVYVVPLRALANEKYNEFKKFYKGLARTALSIGDLDSADPYLRDYDLIVTTSEKLDSVIRHRANWLKDIKVVIIDEIHLLNDPGRGPTLEILITLLRKLLKKIQLIGLSATIGNPKELAEWLEAELIIDEWRPVELKKGVYLEGEVEFD